MSSKYKKLHRFIPIMDRDDFGLIADYGNVKRIEEIFRERVPYSNGNEDRDVEFLDDYLDNLNAFVSWLSPRDLPDITNGRDKCKENILKVKKLLKKSVEDRTKVSRNYLRQFTKDFLYGLGLIRGGLMIAFNENFGSLTNLEPDQMARFVLAKKIGYGKTYLFNNADGDYNFAKHIFDNEMRKKHIATAIKFLEQFPTPRASKGGGDFLYWGEGKDNIRVHFTKSAFGKTKIYRIYRNNDKEHAQHEKDIKKKVSDFDFKAA